ncbi:P-loop NTPase family protein [Staphylococcus pasteuri]|uniref:hypothetical protein n=1 Tax=Staphylococcus pasteuri TaxID=45972 RepID=UPI0016497DEA|nr:hypothetical protein [Staphylococcus pasteuri]
MAKEMNMVRFIVGDVTKEGEIGGGRLVEEMVDRVVYLEGDEEDAYRILRGVKKGFG